MGIGAVDIRIKWDLNRTYNSREVSMSLSQTPVSSGPSLSTLSHLHVTAENCPTCDQPIPRDRLEEIKEKIQARQSAQATQISARIQEQFKREKADALEQAAREAAITLAT